MTVTGLTSIILHDSYFRGKRTRLVCDGHTNNTGDNGAGKTSALILIPIFYGQEPNKLITRAGNKSNFIEYYLPSNQSLIVYEYTRREKGTQEGNPLNNTQTYCVCIYRKRNENNHAYRFIKGRADDTIFHPDFADLFNNGISSHDILRDLFLQDGIGVSSQIDNIIDYRDIIQGDYQNLRKRSKKSSLITYPRAYGLAQGRAQHLGVLTSVVLRHDKLLAQFKTMLVDCFLRDQISFQHAPVNSNDKSQQKNEGLIDDLRSLKAFGKHRDAITKANQKAMTLLERWQALDSHMQISRQYVGSIETHQTQLTSLQESLREQHQSIKQTFADAIDGLKAQKRDKEIELTTKQKHLKALEAQKSDYDGQHIEQKRQALSNLEEFERQLERQEDLLDGLQQSFDKQKRDYDAKLLNLSTELMSTTQRINSQVEQVRQNAEAEIQQAQIEKEAQQAKNEARLHASDDAHRERLNNLQQQARPIELAIEMIKHQVLSEEEKAQKSQLDAELNQARHQADQWQDNLKDHQKNIDTLNEQITQHDNEAKHLNQMADKVKGNIKGLEKQLNPDNNSLLSFLKASSVGAHSIESTTALVQRAGWQQTIAKVIDSELVHRTDLNPQWLSQENADDLVALDSPSDYGLYGLELNLEAIETPEFAEDDLALRGRIDAQVRELTDIEERLQECGKALTGLRRELSSLEGQKTALNNKLVNNSDAITDINQRQRDFEQACEVNRGQRLKEQQSKLETHHSQVQALKEKQAEERQQIIAENSHRLAIFKEQIEAIKERRDDDIAEKQKLIHDAENSKAQQEALLEKSYQQALREEGVDTDTLSQVKKEVARLESQYQTTKSYAGLVEKYERWLKIEWSQASVYQEEINQLKDAIAQLESDIDEKDQEQIQALAQKNSELEQTARRLSNLESQALAINVWQNKAQSYVEYLTELEQIYYQAKLEEQLPALAQIKHHLSINSSIKAPSNAHLSSANINDTTALSDIYTPNLDSADVPWLKSIEKLVPECQKALDDIKKTASVLHNDMTQHIGSQVHQAWQNRQNQYRYQKLSSSRPTTRANDSYSKEDESEVVNLDVDNQKERFDDVGHVLSPEVVSLLDVMSLQMVVNEDFVQLQKLIHSSFVTIGLDICNYYGSLNSIKNKISHIGKRLAQDINTQHKFDALSDIRIELNSKIHEYAIWKDLERFNRHYQEWELTRDTLPDEVFINSFEQVVTSFKQSQIDLNIDSLVEMAIHITENGRQVPIKTDNDLQNASSTGLSMLAVIVVFCGMTRYLCPDEGVTIHWPLDEIGKLSGKNTVLLFDLMAQYNVTLFCAQPDASPALNRFFVNKNLLDLKKGVRQFEIKPRTANNPLLANGGRSPLLNPHPNASLKSDSALETETPDTGMPDTEKRNTETNHLPTYSAEVSHESDL